MSLNLNIFGSICMVFKNPNCTKYNIYLCDLGAYHFYAKELRIILLFKALIFLKTQFS